MGTCNWPVDDTCLPDPGEDPIAVNKLGAAVALAQEVLWALSGRQYGACTVVARPCKDNSCGSRTSLWTGGSWMGAGCSCVGPACNANGPGVVHLPGPVNKVLEVSINGEAMDPDLFVTEGDYLYRKDSMAWPSQDLGRALGSSGTWGVTYLRGYAVPEGVGAFVAQLATEFYAACTSGGKCKLPRRVKTISRQGVTYDMADPTDIYATGKTGLPAVDMWLASVNPNALMSAPRVR